MSWWLGSFTLGLSLCSRHTQLTSLGKRLEVVGRNRPEVKIRFIPEEPVVDHNNWSAGPRVDDAPSWVLSQIPKSKSICLVLLLVCSLMTVVPASFSPRFALSASSPPPPLYILLPFLSSLLLTYLHRHTAVARLPCHIINSIETWTWALCENTVIAIVLQKKKVLGTFQVNHGFNNIM